MDRVTLAGLGAEVSGLGFGAASLGSRVDARKGGALLAEALDLGIDWFDLAPAYGAGQAETIFGDFLRGRDRDRVHVCTKVGLLPPPQPGWKRAILPVARKAVSLIGPLRARIRRSGVTRNRAVTLTPELVRTSLEGSLARLGTDHVDLYALHNATPEALADEGILRALEDLRTSGKARAVAVASDATAARLALERGAPFGVVQLALDALDDDLRAAAAERGMGVVAHSVLGVDGALARAEARLRDDPALRARMQEAGIDGAGEMLLLRARRLGGEGVTLCSMMSRGRLRRNAGVFSRDYPEAAERLVMEALGGAEGAEPGTQAS